MKCIPLTIAVDKHQYFKVIKWRIRQTANRCTCATLHNLTSLNARDTREEDCTIATCFRSTEVSISVYFLPSVLDIYCLCFVPLPCPKIFQYCYFQLIYRIVFQGILLNDLCTDFQSGEDIFKESK